MNIGGIQFPVFDPYGKSTVEIYVSGCNRGCIGCHNPELQNFNYGKKLDIEKLIEYLHEREDLFDIISITGGDLLQQDNLEVGRFLEELVKEFKTSKQFWLFTGCELGGLVKKLKIYSEKDDLNNLYPWDFLLDFFDVIKIGPYKKELKQEGFPSSSNQKILRKGIDY